jgi:hypothetical protein
VSSVLVQPVPFVSLAPTEMMNGSLPGAYATVVGCPFSP